MKTKLYTFLLSSLLCTGALADNEPWQNPQVNEMNRGGMPDCLLAYRADGCRPDQETDV